MDGFIAAPIAAQFAGAVTDYAVSLVTLGGKAVTLAATSMTDHFTGLSAAKVEFAGHSLGDFCPAFADVMFIIDADHDERVEVAKAELHHFLLLIDKEAA